MSRLYRQQHHKREIKDRINEVRELFADSPARSRFEGYPYAHNVGFLDCDNEFLVEVLTYKDCLDELKQVDEE